LFSEYIEESDGAVCEEGRVFVLNSNGESLQCPVCGIYTNSLKSYSLPKIDIPTKAKAMAIKIVTNNSIFL